MRPLAAILSLVGVLRHGHPLEPVRLETLAHGALLLPGLGAHHRTVSTQVGGAQRYFDQGLRLNYGFNHDEAARSFARAAELDPRCAPCFWGVALTLGPNYNVPMLPGRAAAAWEALEKARRLADQGTPVERELIGALSARYAGPQPLDLPAQQPFTQAYADRMRTVAQHFPGDADVQVLFAEALMDVAPWKLWTADGKPAAGTEELIRTLERVLAVQPGHPGANHYYVHAIEASPHPERAERAADSLEKLMPGAGHVVHMPAHIYQRVGRYADASEANRRAIAADLVYMDRTDPPGYYAMYLGHNYGFLAYSAAMEGRGQEALQAARRSAEAVPPEMLRQMPGMDFFASEPLLVQVRFGQWKELLAEPRPAPAHLTLLGLWLHGQGMAHASLGDLAAARADLRALRELPVPADLQASNNPARAILDVAARAVEARIAERERRTDDALRLWQSAVDAEDALLYSEPADWFFPLRHCLGAALLDAGRFPQAEAVFRQDLTRHPRNGWGLFGLWKSLVGEKKIEAAARTQQEFQAAWRRADVPLARPAF